jgi:hypothetical protein
MNYRPVGGRSSETSSHPIEVNKVKNRMVPELVWTQIQKKKKKLAQWESNTGTPTYQSVL